MFDGLYRLGAVGLIALFGLVAAVCLAAAPYLGRKMGWTTPNNDRIDYVTRAQATLITVSGMVLAFSLVQTQANLRQTEELVSKEAATLNTFDRLLLRYGEQGAALRPLLWAYTVSIVEDEWPALRHGEQSQVTSARLRPLSRAVFQLDPQSARQVTIYGEMIKVLDEMTDQREQRLGAANLRLHSEFWVVTLLLGLILVGLNTAIEPIRYRTVSIAAQGLALALLAALVFSGDRPFKGSVSVSPAPIAAVLATMHARI